MQNKGAIKIFAILLALICIYYMTFTYVTYGVREDAKLYAEEFVGSAQVQENAKKYAAGNAKLEKFYIDSVFAKANNGYLDSLLKRPVYNLLITEFTLEECYEKEINQGLDLKGGMNVILEISVPDILKGMSNNNTDPDFNKAVALAEEKQKKDSRDFVTLFGEEYKKINPQGKLAPLFQTIELKGKIDFNTPDEKVIELLRERVDESITTAENTLRARIDKFGVTQPNIQKLEASGRILVELPGVSDKDRVRKLLQGTANLEFWETYENGEVYPMLEEANKRLAEKFKSGDTTQTLLGDSSAIATADTSGVKSDSSIVAAAAVDTNSSLTNALNNPGASDTSKNLNAATASEDTSSIAKTRRENPLFALMTPALQQTEKGYTTRPGPVIGFVHVNDTAKLMRHLSDKKIRSVFPNRMKFLWGFKAYDKEGTVMELVAIKVTTRDGKSPLSGDIITDARKVFDQSSSGSPQISMSMTTEAAQVWKRLTAENVGKSIAIVLDDKVYSYPTVQGEISGGTSSITGRFTVKEADDLVNILRAGKLPAPARIVAEDVVGPTLGKEAISAGLISFVIAFLIILLYMAFYYNKAGWVANVILFTNVFFIIGILASMGLVLTLPGIAGIVLTIGISVDANILIFERIREELRGGKGPSLAIKEGYSHALSSVLDSNITALLLGLVLYVFGTGPIQGFATTLIIGICSSLFCAIFLSRLLFEWMLAKNMSVSFATPFTMNAFKNINIDFVSKRKIFYLISSAFIILGVVFYVKNGGFNLGVDFKGGRTYIVRFDTEQSTQEVRTALAGAFGSAPEVKTYGESTQQKITTTYLIDDNSEDAESKVEAKLNEGLKKINAGYEIMSSQKVGETMSRDIRGKAIWAILFSSLIMFFYIFIRFKKWQYGFGAVLALLHDVLVVLSFYTIFDGIMPFSMEIDQHFIAAILTVMGYSMTDTVVVFDRMREYLSDKTLQNNTFNDRSKIINLAHNTTLSRTINTAATTLFVLLAIFIFGGEVIRGFSFAMLIGIAVGTYSSLCIASLVIVDLDKEKK